MWQVYPQSHWLDPQELGDFILLLVYCRGYHHISRFWHLQTHRESIFTRLLFLISQSLVPGNQVSLLTLSFLKLGIKIYLKSCLPTMWKSYYGVKECWGVQHFSVNHSDSLYLTSFTWSKSAGLNISTD